MLKVYNLCFSNVRNIYGGMEKENWFIENVKRQLAQTQRYMLGNRHNWFLNPINKVKTYKSIASSYLMALTIWIL